MVEDSLQARLYTRVDERPADRAIAFVDARGHVRWRTREEFFARASAHAARLVEMGLSSGQTIILVLPSGELCANLLVACLMVGAVPLLVAPPTLRGQNANLTEILQSTIRRTRARLVICPATMEPARERLDSARTGTDLVFGEAELRTSAPTTALRATPASDDIAAMQLTSGTTGFPRVCAWRQRGVLAALDAMAPAMKLSSEDTCFNWTPLYHDMGLVNNFFLCLAKGVPLVMLSPQDFVKRPQLWLRGLSDTGSTVTWSPNFGFALAAQRVSDDQLEGVRLDHVRAFWNAAERIHLGTLEAFGERFAKYGVRSTALKTNFGCAENIGGATFSDPDGVFVWEQVCADTLYSQRLAKVVNDARDVRTATVVGVGRPAPGIRIHILSPSGTPESDGRVGEIALETPSRMDGYLNDPDGSHRVLSGGLVRTGDLGYLRGDQLFWTGRVRERITIHGKKFDPSDLERVLLQITGLRHGCFAAFGVDDEAAGTQRLIVVSEIQATTTPTHDQITREVRDKVARDLGVPVHEVVLVPSGTLAKTSSGKRRHRAIRDLYRRGELPRHDDHRVHARL